jgi:hypothetical protein
VNAIYNFILKRHVVVLIKYYLTIKHSTKKIVWTGLLLNNIECSLIYENKLSFCHVLVSPSSRQAAGTGNMYVFFSWDLTPIAMQQRLDKDVGWQVSSLETLSC